MAYRTPEPLGLDHDLAAFDCGEPALNIWLKRHARPSHAGGTARVYITTPAGEPRTVVGYYALGAAQVEPQDATERLIKGQPAKRPVPVTLLARLAVDRGQQQRHLGSSLLKDAMLRVLQAADAVGVRALVVNAKHDRARAWYLKYGFDLSPTDPLHLIVLLKDLKDFLRRSRPTL